MIRLFIKSTCFFDFNVNFCIENSNFIFDSCLLTVYVSSLPLPLLLSFSILIPNFDNADLNGPKFKSCVITCIAALSKCDGIVFS